jgi:hypothetical protein
LLGRSNLLRRLLLLWHLLQRRALLLVGSLLFGNGKRVLCVLDGHVLRKLLLFLG